MITLVYWLVIAWHRVVGHRWYFSTSCRHTEHEHCRSTVSAHGGTKKPGTCKWCPTRCLCPCHPKETTR